MSDIFQEVDEDLRYDQATKLWRKYGSYVITGAVMVVAAVAAYVAWDNYHTRQLSAEGDSFIQAVMLTSNGQTREAAEAFAALAKQSRGGFGTLARFNEAALRIEKGESGEAVKIYDELSTSAADRTLRDLATVCAVSLSLDSGDPAELKKRIDPLAAPDNPFRYSARELLALLAVRSNDQATARQLFKELADDKGAPSGIRSRADEMFQALGS